VDVFLVKRIRLIPGGKIGKINKLPHIKKTIEDMPDQVKTPALPVTKKPSTRQTKSLKWK
jgi:hypothetical protein